MQADGFRGAVQSQLVYPFLSTGRQDSTTSRASSHKSSPLSASNTQGSSQARRNAAKQMQLQKRAALVQASRVFNGSPNVAAGPAMTGAAKLGLSSGAGLGKGGAPRIVVVATLTEDLDAWDAVRQFEAEGEDGGVKPVAGKSVDEALEMGLPFAELDITRHRTTLQLHPIPYGALYPLMDAAKAADFVLVLLSPTTSVEPGSWGELAMRSLQAQGLPTVLSAALSLTSSDEASSSKKVHQKAANEVRKSLLSFTRYFAPETEKVYALDDRNERGALLRSMATSAPRRVAWRDFRAWLMGEESHWQADSGDEGDRGLLKVAGWVRGAPLSANRLVHIPDFGDFPVEKITAAPLRHRQKRTKGDVEMQAGDGEGDEEVLDARDDEIADDLVSENEVDDMDNEQTWPTEEEMARGEAAVEQSDLPPAAPGTTPLNIIKDNVKRRTKYDANWIREEDGEDEEDEGDEAMVESGDEEVDSEIPEEDEEEEDFPETNIVENQNEQDDYDEEAEAEALAQYKARMEEEKQRRKEENLDAEFPDEVDTPMDIPARTRFARYRGLKSFRSSPWDPYEDLPREYARIFQFDDFRKTRRRVEASALEEGVEPGVRVWLHIENVPREAARRAGALGGRQGSPLVPFVIFGLLRHEHKKSVLNFTVTRNTEYESPIKSKDSLVLCLGPRRLRVRPIYSQHDLANNGKRGTNNIHKFERYLRGGPGVVSVATIFGPVTFGGANVPTILLRERTEDGESGYDQRGVGSAQMPHLVGMGSLLDADPTRINAKRIILTGHPFKVHKKTSTIRFMFFNPEDVRYYAPLELRSKYGRTGHISESLGTHGYFKGESESFIPSHCRSCWRAER